MQNSLRGSGSAAHLRRPPLPGPVPMNARVLAQLAGCGTDRDVYSSAPGDVYMLGRGGVCRAWRAALHVRPSCMRPRVCCLHGHAECVKVLAVRNVGVLGWACNQQRMDSDSQVRGLSVR